MPASGHRLTETVVDREMADLKAHHRAECCGQLLYSKCGSPLPRSLTITRTCLTDGQKMDAGDRQTEEGPVLTTDGGRTLLTGRGGGGKRETCTDDGCTEGHVLRWMDKRKDVSDGWADEGPVLTINGQNKDLY